MNALRTLLDGVIDYAGLFPPAKLDMLPTVANYADYLADSKAWMLGRLIVPVSRLEEFETAALTLLPTSADDRWLISALTAPAGDPQLKEDCATISAFNDSHADPETGAAMIDCIELKADSADTIDSAVEVIPDYLNAFIELPVDSDPRGLITAVAGGGDGIAAKVRTGGVKAGLHPSPADLARFIAGCAAAKTAFKATAGLHHPMRHFAEDVQTKQFGFFNVLLASCLAWVKQWSAEELIPALEAESLQAFTFDEETIGYREHAFAEDEIETVRNRFFRSFGSCSFVEPIQDLQELQLLTETSAEPTNL